MKIPTFAIMGGKVRLRKWLLSYFPRKGHIYYEPFTGLGNMIYLSRTYLHYEKWILSDINIDFFEALRTVDFNDLPSDISITEFYKYKFAKKFNAEEKAIATLIEPRISFGGKGYYHGLNILSESYVKYDKKYYKVMCENAKLLLKDVEISQKVGEILILVYSPKMISFISIRHIIIPNRHMLILIMKS